MRVVSWNLGAAWGGYVERHEQAWRWLDAADPDIALLQETVPPPWALDRWTIVQLPFEHWASAILVKRGLAVRPVAHAADTILGRFGTYFATAEIEVGGASLIVASVHCRAKPAPVWLTAGWERAAMARMGEADPWSNDVAFAAYRELSEQRPFLIGGDWNTARYAHPGGAVDAANLEFFTRATTAGWVELSLDADGREGKSWFAGDPRRPYQPDHVFADAATAGLLRSSTIDPRPAELGLSDHAPIVLELEVAT